MRNGFILADITIAIRWRPSAAMNFRWINLHVGALAPNTKIWHDFAFDEQTQTSARFFPLSNAIDLRLYSRHIYSFPYRKPQITIQIHFFHCSVAFPTTKTAGAFFKAAQLAANDWNRIEMHKKKSSNLIQNNCAAHSSALENSVAFHHSNRFHCILSSFLCLFWWRIFIVLFLCLFRIFIFFMRNQINCTK